MSETPVPRLDLAPKLKRPLSLWNPLDYLRLLYWVFYFPQALRWYLKEYNNHENLYILNSFRFFCKLLSIIILIIFIIFASLLFTTGLDFSIGIIPGILIILVNPISILFILRYIILRIQFYILSYYLAWQIAWIGNPIMFGIVMIYTVVILMYFFSPVDIDINIRTTAIIILLILRPDVWCISLALNNKTWVYKNNDWYFPFHVTTIPNPLLSYKLRSWLKEDWETGLHNANQLLAYSFQFRPVIHALNWVLAETPLEQVISRVAQLAENPFDWKLINLTSNALKKELISTKATRLNTPSRLTAAGFWYLHEKQPTKAAKAFAEVRSLPNGEEMYTLAHTLAIFHQTKDFSAIANINNPSPNLSPTGREALISPPSLRGKGVGGLGLLRPNTWQAINSCDRVIADAKVIQNSTSRASRAFALNRAIGELLQILDNPETIPEAERYLIIDIATTWKTALEKQALEVGQVEITKPVTNPYIVGDPVEGQLFVGRDDIMRQLEELWLMGTNMQSVVLYGHRRMGKTSILRNLSQRVGAGVKIAYVNLLGVGDVAHEGEVLMALSDAISQTVNIPPPTDEDLLNLPYPIFRRYLQRIINANNVNSDSHKNVETRYIASPPQNPTSNPQTPPSQGLIIALDEFEKIEELIATGKIPPSFMGYLRSLVQMSPKIGFILAGLHTLEEMTADYFQPLYASFTPPIKVSFMEPDATSIILANPGIDDFPLDYTPEALNKIYQVTHGQPFLVQLVGFQLVRRYNDRTFAMKLNTNPIFTLDDVETVINDPVFFQRGRYYFDGVWSQALEGAAGQQTILQALAPYPQGLTIDELVKTTGIDVAILESALQMLIRHDVVFEHQGHWQIIVELFRRWVLRRDVLPERLQEN
jgi:hypothetical protein